MGLSLWTQTNQDAHSAIKPPPLLRYVHDLAWPAPQLCSGAAAPTMHLTQRLSAMSTLSLFKYYRYLEAKNGSLTNFNHSYRSGARASKLQESAWVHFLSITGNFPWLPSSSQWGHENCFDVPSFKPLQSKSTLASNPFRYNSQQQFP